MKSLTRCLSLTLVLLSLIYFVTRILNYLELKEYLDSASKNFHADLTKIKH